MTKDQIQDKIITTILAIAPDIEADEIDASANIQRSLEIDSFDFLKILTTLFETLGVEVPETDYSKVDTLEHMTEYFFKRTQP